jgi:peptide deformylase
MAIKTVLRMGDPFLLKTAQPVTQFGTSELLALIEDMQDTMDYMQGAGIAAPQIGVSSRVVIFGMKDQDNNKNERYPDAESVPYTVLINPMLTVLDDQMEDDWEGCLSVPGLRGIVPRYSALQYTGFDQFGNAINRTVDGFHARVVQHESDHLDGVLYPMRIRDLTNFGFTDILFPNQDIQND